MPTIKGAMRSISDASIETGVPVTTLRDWDSLVHPHRLGKQRERFYDDLHIARIQKVVEINRATKSRGQRTEAPRA